MAKKSALRPEVRALARATASIADSVQDVARALLALVPPEKLEGIAYTLADLAQRETEIYAIVDRVEEEEVI